MALKVTNKNRKKIKQDPIIEIQDEIFDNSNGVIDVDWNSFEEVPTKNPFASVPYDVIEKIEPTLEEDLKESIKLDAIENQIEFNTLKLITGVVIFLFVVSFIF